MVSGGTAGINEIFR